MKIISQNKNKESSPILFPIKATCEHCGSIIELESENDFHEGYLGMMYFKCPCCKKEACVDHPDLDKKVTIDNLNFPDNFWHFDSTDGDGVHVQDKEVTDYIKEAILRLRKNRFDDDYGDTFYTGTGDTFVYVKRYPGDEEYMVVVAQNYYQTEIPFELEDYA